jgi:hypothetical protein
MWFDADPKPSEPSGEDATLDDILLGFFIA